jgi:hypothetical protein
MSTPVAPRRLQGWKEIATFLDTSPRTAQRWEAYLHLPVRRETRIRGATVYALPDELSAWRASHGQEIEDDKRSAPDAAATNQPADAPGTPWHRRPYARPLVLAAAVVVLGLFVVMWWQLPSLRGRQSAASSASAHAEASPPTAYSAPSGNTALVMRVQVGSERAVVTTSSGAMTTVVLPSRRELALVPSVKEPAVELLLAEVAPRGGGLEALREVARQRLLLAQPVVMEAAEGLSVEILRTTSAPASESRPSRPPQTCCVSCGTLTVCANRVETSCGSCDAAK